MNGTPDPRRGGPEHRDRPIDVVDEHPIQGGLTGFALVALATLVLSVAGAGIAALALLLLG